MYVLYAYENITHTHTHSASPVQILNKAVVFNYTNHFGESINLHQQSPIKENKRHSIEFSSLGQATV